jgi:hypothetical protein
MEVIKCGSMVAIKGNHDTDGIITCLSIRYNNVSYEVSYFNNGEYKQVWLVEDEFTLTNGDRIKIGFK